MILHYSIVIQNNSYGVLFNGLQAELLAILDSVLPVAITSDYIRGPWLARGGGES